MTKKYIFIIVGIVCMFTACGCCNIMAIPYFLGQYLPRPQPRPQEPPLRLDKSHYPKEYAIFGTGTQAEVAAALKKIAAEPLPKRETDQYGITPLIVAASTNCDPAVIDMIIKAGWKPEAEAKTEAESSWGLTALDYAAAQNTNPEITKLLAVYSGINAEDRPIGRGTPLYFAINYNPNLEVARMLIRLHADVKLDGLELDGLLQDAIYRWEGYVFKDAYGQPIELPICPYDKTSMGFYQQRTALVRELLEAGAKPSSRILADVASQPDDKSLEIFKLLLAAGANIGNALYESYNSLEKTRLLLDAGAKVTASSDRCAPLYIAMQSRSNPDVGVLLVKAGANVNDECIGGNTPLLELAGEWRKLPDDNQSIGQGNKTADEQAKALLRLAAALIDAGADVNAANNRGETALDLVQDSKRPELREFLLKAGAKAGSAQDRPTKN